MQSSLKKSLSHLTQVQPHSFSPSPPIIPTASAASPPLSDGPLSVGSPVNTTSTCIITTPNHEEIQAGLRFLKKTRIFSSIADEHLVLLGKLFEKRTFPPHAILIKEGDPQSFMLVVLKGAIHRMKGSSTNYLHPGDVSGVLHFVNTNPCYATLKSGTTDIDVLTISSGAFQSLLGSHSTLSLIILQSFVQDFQRRRQHSSSARDDRSVTSGSSSTSSTSMMAPVTVISPSASSQPNAPSRSPIVTMTMNLQQQQPQSLPRLTTPPSFVRSENIDIPAHLTASPQPPMAASYFTPPPSLPLCIQGPGSSNHHTVIPGAAKPVAVVQSPCPHPPLADEGSEGVPSDISDFEYSEIDFADGSALTEFGGSLVLDEDGQLATPGRLIDTIPLPPSSSASKSLIEKPFSFGFAHSTKRSKPKQSSSFTTAASRASVFAEAMEPRFDGENLSGTEESDTFPTSAAITTKRRSPELSSTFQPHVTRTSPFQYPTVSPSASMKTPTSTKSKSSVPASAERSAKANHTDGAANKKKKKATKSSAARAIPMLVDSEAVIGSPCRRGKKAGRQNATSPNTEDYCSPLTAASLSSSPLKPGYSPASRSSGKARAADLKRASPDPRAIAEGCTTAFYYLMYEELEPLGAGGMGAVFKVLNRTNNMFYAVKKFHGTPNSNDLLMMSFDHQNIARYFNSFVGPYEEYNSGGEESDFEGDFLMDDDMVEMQPTSEVLPSMHDTEHPSHSIFLVMQYYSGGTLYDYLQKRKAINRSKNLDMLLQITSGLEYLHQKGYIHRDLKPSNIFISDEGVLKIADFGLMTKHTVRHHSKKVGTPSYTSPEQMNGNEYDTATDLWSLGIIMFELYQTFGTLMERDEVLQVLRRGGPIPESRMGPYPDEMALVSRLLDPNPENRLKLPILRASLNNLHKRLQLAEFPSHELLLDSPYHFLSEISSCSTISASPPANFTLSAAQCLFAANNNCNTNTLHTSATSGSLHNRYSTPNSFSSENLVSPGSLSSSFDVVPGPGIHSLRAAMMAAELASAPTSSTNGGVKPFPNVMMDIAIATEGPHPFCATAMKPAHLRNPPCSPGQTTTNNVGSPPSISMLPPAASMTSMCAVVMSPLLGETLLTAQGQFQKPQQLQQRPRRRRSAPVRGGPLQDA